MAGLPWWLSGKESACNADVGLIPASGRCSGEGNGNTLQYSYLGNPMDRGAWRDIVHGVAKGLDMSRECMFLGSLSHHNKDLQ